MGRGFSRQAEREQTGVQRLEGAAARLRDACAVSLRAVEAGHRLHDVQAIVLVDSLAQLGILDAERAGTLETERDMVGRLRRAIAAAQTPVDRLTAEAAYYESVRLFIPDPKGQQVLDQVIREIGAPAAS